MDSTNRINKKVALLGSHAVGKTSLISQFVYQKFSEKYLTTIGLKVDKKTVDYKDQQVNLVIWDIAGQDKTSAVPHYYLRGCSGIIYVTDMTRESTFEDLDQKVKELKELVKGVEILVAANKSDLLTEAEQQAAIERMPVKPTFMTSAKTGLNVEEMFLFLAHTLVGGKEEEAKPEGESAKGEEPNIDDVL